MESLKNLIKEQYKAAASDGVEIIYESEISIRENTMLHAWYVLNAIKKLEDKKVSKAKIQEIKNDFYWAYTWEKTIGKTDMQKIEEHLKNVCDHHIKEYKNHYNQEWLLYFDETLYERLVKKHFPFLLKVEKEEVNAAETVKAINEI